jgi:PqqD family protein of HPr-rel-A system
MQFALARADTRIDMLGDDAVVFNPSSWETHLLNPAAAAILLAIARAPKTDAELADLLGRLLRDGDRSAAQHHAQATVGQLGSLGLVVAVEPS